MLIAANAGAVNQAVLIAGNRNDGAALIPLMSERFRPVHLIAVAAVRAGISRESSFQTGCRGDFRLVVMTQRQRVVAPAGHATGCAGIGGIAHFQAGCRSDFFLHIVAGSLGNNRAADFTDLGAGAGGFLSGSVAGGRGFLKIVFAAADTGMVELSGIGAGRIDHDNPFVPLMAGGLGFIGHIAVTAVLANIGCMTALCAAAFRDFRLIVVSQRLSIVALIGQVAVGTVVVRIACLGAGGGFDGRSHFMPGGKGQDRATDCADLGIGAGRGSAGGMALRRYRFQIVIIAADAAMVDHAVAVAGGVNDGRSLVPGMAQSVGVLRHIAVAAVGAGIGGEAALVAGRGGDFRLIVVTQRQRITAVVSVITVLAIVGGIAHFQAGRGDNLRLHTVTVGAFQNRTADRAELIGGAGRFRAGGMPVSGNRLQETLTAADTAMVHHAVAVAGGTDNRSTIVPGVAQGIRPVGNIAVSAIGAGEGRVARFKAGRLRNVGLVIVSMLTDVIAPVGVIAVRAGIDRIAGFGTGFGNDSDLNIVTMGAFNHSAADLAELVGGAGRRLAGGMSGGRGRFHDAVIAADAGILHHALTVAGGAGDSPALVELVSQRVKQGFNVAVAAAGAGLENIAALGACGLLHGLLVIVSQLPRVIALIGVIAVGAGVGRVAHFTAGSLGYFRVNVMSGRRCQYRAADRADLGIGAGSLRSGRMSVDGQGFQIVIITFYAAVVHDTGAVAGGISQGNSGIPGVAGGRCMVAGIAAVAAGTVVSCEAVLCAGGGRHIRNIVMAQRLDIGTLVGESAAGADVRSKADVRAGRGSHDGVNVMPQRRCQLCAADRADLGVGAGGGGTGRVSGGGQRFQLAVVAADALMLNQALAAAGGAVDLCPGIHQVAHWLRIVVGERISAAGAGVRGISSGGAGRGGHFHLVGVTEFSLIAGRIGEVAVGAGIGRASGFRAGSRGDLHAHIMAGGKGQHRAADRADLGIGAGSWSAGGMACRGQRFQINLSAAQAAMLNHAVAVAGGPDHGRSVVPGMAQGFHGIADIAVTAAGADVGVISAFQAGRVRGGRLVNVFILIDKAAVHAGPGGPAQRRAAGGSYLRAHRVAFRLCQYRAAGRAKLGFGAGGGSAGGVTLRR